MDSMVLIKIIIIMDSMVLIKIIIILKIMDSMVLIRIIIILKNMDSEVLISNCNYFDNHEQQGPYILRFRFVPYHTMRFKTLDCTLNSEPDEKSSPNKQPFTGE